MTGRGDRAGRRRSGGDGTPCFVSVEALSREAPETLYARLEVLASWPSWSPADAVELLSDNRRRVTTGPVTVVEAIVLAHRPERQVYRLVEGLPLHDYEAEVRIAPHGQGARIVWSARFRAGRMTAWFWRRAVRRVLTGYARGLAGAARSGPR